MKRQKARMREQLQYGWRQFVLKEGIVRFFVLISLLYVPVSFFLIYRGDVQSFFSGEAMLRHASSIIIFFAAGIYWGLIWYWILKQEQHQTREEKTVPKKRKRR
ncbi:hypothetical protein [Alkalicoccus luteus]|uniref:Uncharacterized protein n=1 Tax=Alkalicoccus luteus TaxID=1237094 RepID=A0A969TU58_9BACI|nr:hypothetical protein [Alkalicoccus luteus]NJP36636.1 hypothetical protein [Alkalicoccus luteus]